MSLGWLAWNCIQTNTEAGRSDMEPSFFLSAKLNTLEPRQQGSIAKTNIEIGETNIQLLPLWKLEVGRLRRGGSNLPPTKPTGLNVCTSNTKDIGKRTKDLIGCDISRTTQRGMSLKKSLQNVG